MGGADWEAIWRDQPHRMHRWPAEPLIRWASGLASGARVLEVGCGNGANLWFLAWEGFEVAGCDISPGALDRAVRLLEEHGRPDGPLTCELRPGPATQLPFADNRFDAVCDVQCFQHLPPAEVGRAYREVARVLVAGGRFFSMHMDPGTSDVAALYPDVGPVAPFDPAAAQGAGLQVSAVDLVSRTTGALRVSWQLVDATRSPRR